MNHFLQRVVQTVLHERIVQGESFLLRPLIIPIIWQARPLHNWKFCYEFRSLPFSLSMALRVFTRLVKVVAGILRHRNVKIFVYQDDWLVGGQHRTQNPLGNRRIHEASQVSL